MERVERVGRVRWQFALLVAGLAALLAAPSWAVVRPVPGGVAVTDTQGQPLAGATITLKFGDETLSGETDDDGVLGIHVSGSREEAPEGALVLPGDGSGTITYEGGPEGGVPFTVLGGVISVSQAVPASGDGFSLGTREYLIGAGVVGGGALVLSRGGDDGGSAGSGSVPTPTPTLADLFGRYDGTIATTGTTVSGCGTISTFSAPLNLSGSSDGSNFLFDKGGLPFRGVLRPDGSFDVLYEGPISGFAGLPDNTTISWRIVGNIQGSELSATGEATVGSGGCANAVISTTTTGVKVG